MAAIKGKGFDSADKVREFKDGKGKVAAWVGVLRSFPPSLNVAA
jgi:hypothetical protein